LNTLRALDYRHKKHVVITTFISYSANSYNKYAHTAIGLDHIIVVKPKCLFYPFMFFDKSDHCLSNDFHLINYIVHSQ